MKKEELKRIKKLRKLARKRKIDVEELNLNNLAEMKGLLFVEELLEPLEGHMFKNLPNITLLFKNLALAANIQILRRICMFIENPSIIRKPNLCEVIYIIVSSKDSNKADELCRFIENPKIICNDKCVELARTISIVSNPDVFQQIRWFFSVNRTISSSDYVEVLNIMSLARDAYTAKTVCNMFSNIETDYNSKINDAQNFIKIANSEILNEAKKIIFEVDKEIVREDNKGIAFIKKLNN